MPADPEHLDAYLARLGLDREPPSVEAMFRLHEAHAERIPYETLWIQLGEPRDRPGRLAGAPQRGPSRRLLLPPQRRDGAGPRRPRLRRHPPCGRRVRPTRRRPRAGDDEPPGADRRGAPDRRQPRWSLVLRRRPRRRAPLPAPPPGGHLRAAPLHRVARAGHRRPRRVAPRRTTRTGASPGATGARAPSAWRSSPTGTSGSPPTPSPGS